MEKKYLKNSMWLLSEKLIRILINFVAVIYLANYLGPDLYGKVNYVYSIGMIIFTISSLGMDNITTRECLYNKDNKNNLLFLSSVTRGMVFLAVSITYAVIFTDSSNVLVFLILFSYVYTFIIPYELYYAAIADSRYFSVIRSLSFIVSSALKIIFSYYHKIELVALSFALEGILYIILSSPKLVGSFKVKKLKNNMKDFFKVIKLSIPLFVVALILIFSSKIDQLMITHLLSYRDLGVYSVAISIASALCILPNTFTNAFYGKILKTNTKDLICIIYRVNIILGICISIFSLFLMPYVLRHFFSPDYFQAATVIQYLLLSNIFKSLGYAMNFIIIKESKQKYSVVYYSLGLLLIFMLNFIFIPIYGIIGASIISLIGQIFTNLIFPLLFRDNVINAEIKNIMVSFVKAPLYIIHDIKAITKI